MDAIELLKNDHRTVERLFSRYEDTTDQAEKTRDDLAHDMIHELSVHAVIEEEVFYPAVRLAVPDEEGDVLEALEEHHIVKWTLSELEKLDSTDERFHPKVTVLIEMVRHHVEEEEGEMFPQVRKALSDAQLDDLGNRLDAAKAKAPTHPHPRSPDTPPGNVVAGAVASVVDKARDAGREVIENARDAIGGARDAGEDAVEDARRSASRTARDSRKTAKSAAKKAKKATRSATKTAKASGRKAVANARKAAGTTKKSARKASGSAKKTARKATGTAKKTGRKATGTTKKTAKKATGSAKKTARKATKR